MILNRQPLLILIVAFILGILIQDCFSFGLIFTETFAFLSFVILILFCFNNRFIFLIKNYLLCFFFCGLGMVFHFLNTPKELNLNVLNNEEIVFKISKKLNSTEKYKKYEAVVEVKNQQFLAVLNVPQEENELDFNHYYKTKAFIVHPHSPEYDFQFDYAKYLKRKEIFYQIYCKEIFSKAKRSDLSFTEKIKQKRLEVLHKIDHVKINAQSREFLKGIILADRTEMDVETVKDFNRSGLVHFLAISGTHIAVIFGMFYFLLMKFSPVGFRKFAIVLSLVLIWVFAIFIGFGNSVVRSCLMITVYFVYILLQRKPDLLHSLALSAFVILMIDTQQVFDVGFQLSYLAVLGIFWLNEPILNLLPKSDNFFKKIVFNTISISIAAQLATLPVVLYYFHQFSLISFVANFIIVPFSEIVIIFSFVMTFMIAFGIDFNWLNIIYDFAIHFLLKAIHWFASFDSLYFENIPMNLAEVFALLLIVFFLRMIIIKVTLRNIFNLAFVIILFGIVKITSTMLENSRDEILVHHYKKESIVSIKKGDCVIFYSKSEAHRQEIQQYIINPYLSSRRISDVQYVSVPKVVKILRIKGKLYSIK